MTATTTDVPRYSRAMPTSARQVLSAVRDNGWSFTTEWKRDAQGFPYFRISTGRAKTWDGLYVHAWITWHVDPDTGQLKISNHYYRLGPNEPWGDLANLKVLAEMVRDNPVRA